MAFSGKYIVQVSGEPRYAVMERLFHSRKHVRAKSPAEPEFAHNVSRPRGEVMIAP
jgi:hypothetical protein